MGMHKGLLALLVAAGLGTPASAQAAAPANDDRAQAQTLAAGADVRGTTVEATREASDPPNCPAKGGATVWYRYTAPASGPARFLLTTPEGSRLDAEVAIYEQDNSTLRRVGCAETRRGTLSLAVALEKGTYLVRVAEREGSGSGAFRLRFSGVLSEPTGTGRDLGRDGRAQGTLNALTQPFARVSRRLRAGRDYKVRVFAGDPATCDVRIRLIDADGDTVRNLGCRDYTVITPTPETAGRWTLALEAAGGSAEDARFQVAIVEATGDDLAPGRFIGGFGVARGSVSGRGADAQDVIRFDVTQRAEITLQLATRGSVSMGLRTEAGRAVTSTSASGGEPGQIRTRLRPGRFYLVVSAARSAGGRYTVRRLTRVITATKLAFDRAEKGPGGASTLTVQVSSGASGRATVTFERFDPSLGWRFYQRRTVTVRGGRGSVSIPTATIGRYRARGAFLGTRRASPSQARRAAYVRVRSPLRD
jgi:hypothetical protein